MEFLGCVGSGTGSPWNCNAKKGGRIDALVGQQQDVDIVPVVFDQVIFFDFDGLFSRWFCWSSATCLAADLLRFLVSFVPPLATMSSLQEDLHSCPRHTQPSRDNGPGNIEPPPGLEAPGTDRKDNATKETSASLGTVACKCAICHRDCCWFPSHHYTHRCAEHKYW